MNIEIFQQFLNAKDERKSKIFSKKLQGQTRLIDT
jgi:hypothetical protein